ncbi:MAG TPA: DUF2249 domain-containing protein [Acidimicrobiales bacterium]
MPTLDLRTMPPAERHRRIFEDLDALAPGETLALVNDHRPSPLRYQLEATRAGQYQWEDGDDGPEVYTASITCRARILDVRPTIAEGGEPFDSIMAAVAELDDEQPLVILVPFEPVPLEGVLGSQGFVHEAEQLETGDWRVTFQRPA